MSEEFLTVSQLGQLLRDILRCGLPRAIWVCGEVQEMREKNNHLYFTLSEKDPSSSQVIAKIGATIWANNRLKIEGILKSAENSFFLKDDIQVKLLVKVDYYPPFGQIRVMVEGIDPVYTLGKIAQDRQRLIALLKQKGVLEANKRLILPEVILNVGLITSDASAAYHDFIEELKKSGYGFKVYLIDALMQGKNSPDSVAGALRRLDGLGLDALVITRGGGSVTDLSAFDSELIALTIAQCRTPVICGIGHEINTTITDLAAHTFAKTPTAVAQMLIARAGECLVQLERRREDVLAAAGEYIKGQRRCLKTTADAFGRVPVTLVKLSRQRLLHDRARLSQAYQGMLKQQWAELTIRRDALKKTIHLRLQRAEDKIKQYQKLVGMADPRNTLRRGFTITRGSDGNVLYSALAAKKAKRLITAFADGLVESDVSENA